ncbi:MAG TPA: peptidase M48, partial [Rhodocyclaceae bacterium]
LDRFDRVLPGDPGIAFLKGVSLDAMGDRQRAAEHYAGFLRAGAQGDPARFAASRLQAFSAGR